MSLLNELPTGGKAPREVIYSIPIQFTKYGDQFRLLGEDENGFIYERKSSSGRIYYEVFKRRVRNVPHTLQEDINSKYYGCLAMEIYPGDEDFGVWAWFCMSLGRATLRLGCLSDEAH